MSEATARIRPLADAVATAFYRARFTPEDLLAGALPFTEFEWQAPPIETSCRLGGALLSDHLDFPLHGFLPNRAFEYYLDTLQAICFAPQTVEKDFKLKNLQVFAPRERPGLRNLAFTLPEGWPSGDIYGGAMFALEMARAFRISAVCKESKIDESNDYVVTEQGVIGIREGVVAGGEGVWTTSVAREVFFLRQKPRGYADTVPQYDLLERLRTALHRSHDRFSFDEFTAIDYALCALRILANGQVCHEMLKAIKGMPKEAAQRKRRHAALSQAVEIMESYQHGDKTKISLLVDLLVPEVWNLKVFCRKIYDVSKPAPAQFYATTEKRIIRVLKHEKEKCSV